MRKRLTSIALAVAMTVGMAGAMASAQPGPNGKNDRGLCTAYFNGSERGREQKRKAPPFQALEAAAEEAWEGDEDASTEEKVASYCDGLVGGRAGRSGR